MASQILKEFQFPGSMNSGVQPETASLLLLVRPEPSSHDLATIARYLEADGFDWTAFTERALSHRLVPLLERRVEEWALPSFPEDIRKALKVYSENNRQRGGRLLGELHDVITALGNAGIRVMTIKGPVFAAQAYADISLREYNDLDFLVDRDDYRATLRCLQELGYQRDRALDHRKELLAWRYYGQDILFKPQQHIAVEPHWRLLPSTFPAGFEFGDFWPDAASYQVEGHCFVSLSAEDTLLTLCIHHGKEQWCWLRQVCDVAYFVARNPQLDWQRALDKARSHHCLRAFLLGLCLSRRLLATEFPDIIVDRIEADEQVGILAGEAVTNLLSGQPNPPDIQRVSRFRARLQDNRLRKSIYVLRTVLMPSNRHFRMIYFSPALEFLYYPLKWGHDYLLLPVWKLYKRMLAA